jgi:hypothetical protein
MFTRLLIPLRRASRDALFVGGWRIVPPSMDFHRTMTDIARFLIPRTLLVIIGNVVPVLVVFDRATTVLAGFVMPLGGFLRATFLMSRGRVIPVAVNV